MAIQVDPTFTSFGTLSGATFGGSGIPNNAVAITSVTSGSYNITLGLTAHARYSNPAPANDGAGAFYAVGGGDTFSGGNSNPDYSRWNVGFFVDINPNVNFLNTKGFSVRLYYDKNPAFDNDVTTSLAVAPSLLTGLSMDPQNSWNLGMDSVFGSSAFDPNANGEYSFALALLQNNVEIGRAAINVVVNSTGTIPPPPTAAVPDGGSSVMLLGSALAGLAFMAKRK